MACSNLAVHCICFAQLLLTAIIVGRPALDVLRTCSNIAINDIEADILTAGHPDTSLQGNVWKCHAPACGWRILLVPVSELLCTLESQQIDTVEGTHVGKEADWTSKPGVEGPFPSVELSSRYSVEAQKRSSTEDSWIVPFDKW